MKKNKTEGQKILEESVSVFGNLHRLSQHLGVSASTPYRWRDGTFDIPPHIILILKGYIAHPERVGQDIVAKLKESKK